MGKLMASLATTASLNSSSVKRADTADSDSTSVQMIVSNTMHMEEQGGNALE